MALCKKLFFSYKLELDLYVETQVWYTNIVLPIGVRNKNKIFILYIYVCYNTGCTFDIRYIVHVHYIFCRKIQLGMLMSFYGKIDQEDQFHRRRDQILYEFDQSDICKYLKCHISVGFDMTFICRICFFVHLVRIKFGNLIGALPTQEKFHILWHKTRFSRFFLYLEYLTFEVTLKLEKLPTWRHIIVSGAK